MNISVGIVGLPNVGKSTLFNTLTKATVDAQNYPFCTIEPNKGIVPVEDHRLEKLSEIAKSKNIVNAIVEFVDIAGLVKGASKGEGLGNQFLANIREVAAIVHVVRDFEDDNIIHVENKVDPLSDIDTINTELILKDMETIQKKIKEIERKARADKKLQIQLDFLEAMQEYLGNDNLAVDFEYGDDKDVLKFRKELFLLTDKPVLYLVNAKDGKPNFDISKLNIQKNNALSIDVKIENELMDLDEKERDEYMQELGMNDTGLNMLVRKCYDILGLISFFTAGEQEVRAWTIKKGSLAPEAAGAIHGDFEKNFIAADVVTYEDFVKFGGWNGSRENGKVRLEGKTYKVKEGDIILFKHN